MKKVFYFLLAVFVSFTFSCKKSSNPAPAAPVISFVSFTTTDDVTGRLTINFTDNDGDIGFEQAQQDNSNIDFYLRYYYKDTVVANQYDTYWFHDGTGPPDPIKDSTIYVYHIPYITNNIKTKVLDGQIIIDLNGYKPASTPMFNNFRYNIWIYDRAGHKSNVVTTPGFHTSY